MLRAVSRFEETTKQYSAEELQTPPATPKALHVHVDCAHPHPPRIDWLAVVVLAVMLEALFRVAASAIR